MRFRRTAKLLSLAIAVATSIVGTGALVEPSPPDSVSSVALPPTGAGVDISFPQCAEKSHVELPSNLPFAIVGVNGGTASTSNPCFLSEYNSAVLLTGATDQPHVALYVNTGNPALAGLWWPDSDATQSGSPVTNPDGACAHLAGAACAYVYGYSMAQADYRRIHRTLTTVPGLWWLDVETTNTWQADTAANAASLTGMVDFFQAEGLSVGIYSTSYQWAKIAGVTDDTGSLSGLRSWLAGGSELGAPIDCEHSPLTPGGWVAMVQYVTHLDNDYSCSRFSGVHASVTAPAAPGVGSRLRAVAGDWGATDVDYLYQWNQNGVPITGATDSLYIPTAADGGTDISVTITGIAPGYSTTSQTSSVVVIPVPQPIQLVE